MSSFITIIIYYLSFVLLLVLFIIHVQNVDDIMVNISIDSCSDGEVSDGTKDPGFPVDNSQSWQNVAAAVSPASVLATT